MCFWGEALVLGPNINAPMDPADNEAAWTALHKALRLSATSKVSDREKALIQALSHRYDRVAPEDRSPLDQAYANAMREVAKQYPGDADVQTLFAEALMDTTPWDYWQDDQSPKPVTEEFTAALDAALEVQSDHPGANHLYIHAVEAVHPERGIQAAERLDGLVPGAGHLVHMPGHIYIRVGRYHDAVRVNLDAAAADENYIAQCRAQGFYPLLYYPHNLHFLWFAAMMGGEGTVAIDAAEKIQAKLSDEMIESQRLRPTLVFALERFGRWDAILDLPAPPDEQLYAKAMWRYGRGLALLHTEGPAAAAAEFAQLTTITESEAAQELEQPYFFGHTQVKIAHRILQGELAGARGNEDAKVSHLRAAVELQDSLPYMEPPYWYEPVRQSLGAALLQAGRPAEAEQVFREDLDYFAENGWSLHGLAQSLRAQSKTDEADTVQARFEKAWAHADIQLAAAF
jgi:tetratricopeptide (TPR) repeat protein